MLTEYRTRPWRFWQLPVYFVCRTLEQWPIFRSMTSSPAILHVVFKQKKSPLHPVRCSLTRRPFKRFNDQFSIVARSWSMMMAGGVQFWDKRQTCPDIQSARSRDRGACPTLRKSPSEPSLQLIAPRVRHFSRIVLSHWTDSQKRKSTVRIASDFHWFRGFLAYPWCADHSTHDRLLAAVIDVPDGQLTP